MPSPVVISISGTFRCMLSNKSSLRTRDKVMKL